MTRKSFYTHATQQATQTQPVLGRQMVRNNAGGYVFGVSQETRLDRFLILGSENGSYYCAPKEMTLDNASAVMDMIKTRGVYVVERTVEISQSGRAPKNDPALFVLALCLASGDAETKNAVRENLAKTARTSTHFFLFLQYASALRGWGRSLKKTAARWYEEKSSAELAYQATKYKNREGWTHYDALNLAHAKTSDPEKQSLFRMIVDVKSAALEKNDVQKLTSRYSSVEEMPALDYYRFCSNIRKLETEDLADSVRKYRLPHETLPSESLADPEIWKALLESSMPMTAMLRNIGRMASLGIFKDPHYVGILKNRILDTEQLKRARIHPLNLLTAWKTYCGGHGVKGSLSWEVDAMVKDALEGAFYLAFKTVAPTGKNIFIGLDVSGSMCSTAWNGLSAREISTVMCMATVRSEPNYIITAFSRGLHRMHFSKNSSLEKAIRKTENMDFSATDCALPMIYAQEHRIPADAFIVYTDNETWCGTIHPFQALRNYRKAMAINAKLIVVGITATHFSIADPSDGGMMDVVGFDSAAPQIIGDFIGND